MTAARSGWVRTGVIVACAIAAACGGGGGSSGSGGAGGGTGGGTGGGYSPGSTYLDVVGVNATPTQVPTNQWPSWLHVGVLLPACAAGEFSYADLCWSSMEIDADAKSVKFLGANGASASIAVGSPVPGELGTMNEIADPIEYSNGLTSKVYPLPFRTGYVGMSGPSQQDAQWIAEDVWDSPVGPSMGRTPIVRSPWVLGNEMQLQGTTVLGFLVKTTMLYGFRARDVNNAAAGQEVVHNWPLVGFVKVGGTTLPLPTTIAAVAAAAGVQPGSNLNGSYVDLQGSRVRFWSDADLLSARVTYHGMGQGLTDPGLVTRVEFHTLPVPTPTGL